MSYKHNQPPVIRSLHFPYTGEAVVESPGVYNHSSLVGTINGFYPFLGNNSASRASMDASHIQQATTGAYPTPMIVSSGADIQYADTIWDIRLEGTQGEDVLIMEVLKKYTKVGMESPVERNTETYVIYRNLTTNIIDVAVVPDYRFHHIYFGFKYVHTPVFKKIQKGQVLPADTILATSPQADLENNRYMLGREVNVALGAWKEVADDGIAISESLAEKLSTYYFGTASFNIGENDYPLNLHGTLGNVKILPDIGEKIPETGLLFATRPLDEDLAPVQLTQEGIMNVDHDIDKCYYAIAGATIMDITVHRSHDSSVCNIPVGIGDQAMKYFKNRSYFEEKLEAFYKSTQDLIKNERARYSPRLHRLIVRTLELSHKHLKRSNRVVYRGEPLKEFRITVTYMKQEPAEIGHKLTCLSAGKGVVTAIIPDHLMPIDQHGVRAEALLDDNSTIHRMNTGRLWSSELTKHVQMHRLRLQRYLDEGMPIEQVYQELLAFYQIASPWYHKLISEGLTDWTSRKHHLNEFIKGVTGITIPHGTLDVGSAHSLRMHEAYPLEYGKVTLFDIDGNPVESKDDILIAPLYMIRLEKIGADWSATTAPYRQGQGIIAKLSSDNKNQLPYRNQAVRILGETEIRLTLASLNPVVVSALLRVANSPELTQEVVYNILAAENPSTLKESLDYDSLGEKSSRVLDIIDHIHTVMGTTISYIDETEFSDVILEPIGLEFNDEVYTGEN